MKKIIEKIFKTIELNPLVKRVNLKIQPPDIDSQADFERLKQAAGKDLSISRKLACQLSDFFKTKQLACQFSHNR